ncbi:MAG TPA: toll/interleukin-1 receptor domain-containing protein, partial [Ktedonobacteraceae bacterium]|nr:toll/interleukin-1 receptor domain-containing protein [Ktedonobacteraceae bacterium]
MPQHHPIVYTSSTTAKLHSTTRRRRTKRIVETQDTQNAKDTGSPQKDFFISYTHADQRWAEWIAWQLEAAGSTTMLQAWDFVAGSNFVNDMDVATRQAHRTIAVLSPDYFASSFSRAEWEAAFRRDPTGEQGLLLPVRVRPCDVEGLLGQVVYIDLVDQDDATARASLLQGVKRERRKPGSPPALPFTQHVPQKS